MPGRSWIRNFDTDIRYGFYDTDIWRYGFLDTNFSVRTFGDTNFWRQIFGYIEQEERASEVMKKMEVDDNENDYEF